MHFQGGYFTYSALILTSFSFVAAQANGTMADIKRAELLRTRATTSIISFTTQKENVSSGTSSAFAATAVNVPANTVASNEMSPGSDQCREFVSVRKNIRTISKAELTRYTNAVNQIRKTTIPGKKYSVFAEFAAIHGAHTFQAHRGAYFLPWHRQMLYEFEAELNKVASPGPKISIPYWDFTAYNTNFTRDPMWQRMGGADMNRPIPNAPFKDWSSRVRRQHKVRRGFTAGIETLDTFVSSSNMGTLIHQTSQSFAAFSAYLEGVHNSPHVAINGDMGDITTAANDPIFYSHHAYIDMIWRRWQEAGAGNKFGGVARNGAPASLDTQMNPFGRTVRHILMEISSCVRYESSGGFLRQAVEMSAVHDDPIQESSVRPGPFKFASMDDKRSALLRVAKVKIEDPLRARKEAIESARAEKTNVDAMRKLSYTEAEIMTFCASFRALELLNAVDVNKHTVETIEDGATSTDIKDERNM
jgi:hypothetical protein